MRNLLTACAVVVIILAMTGMAHAYDTVFVDASYTTEPVLFPGLCFYTIQAGVDGVDPAGTVVIMGDRAACPGCSSGVYNECVQIFGPGRDSITVCTEGDVELTACDGGSAFYITAANVTVTSGYLAEPGTFTINGDPDATAFMYEGAVGGLLENVSIDASNTALFMAFSDGITIRGNDVNCVPPPAGYIQEARFIEMTRTNDCLVEYNLANDFCTCIYLNDGDDTSMSNNRNIFQFNTLTHQPIMRDDQSDGRGFYIKDNCQDNQILNNTISGWCQFTQSAYAGHITGGIGLSTKADNPGRTIIVGNEITACGWGIELDSFGNTITDNLIHDLRLHTISGGGGYGLQFYYKRNSSYNTITSNEIYNNPYDGIRYRGSSVDLTGNVITCNQIYNNATGANGSALTLVQDLKGNWWGDATGPLDTKTLPGQPNYNNPGGLGNSVTSFIDYFPFKADPDGTLPYVRVQNVTQMWYYQDIEPAVVAAIAGDEILALSSAGSYNEGIIDVNKGLYIHGPSCSDKAVINATEDTGTANAIGPTGRGWLQINNGAVVDLENFVIDGAGQLVHTAVHYHGDSGGGSVKCCDIMNIAHTPAGYQGRGINNYGLTGSVDVLDCTFSNIYRIGVFTFGDGATTLINNCTYTGKGAGDWLDYAVEAGNGGDVTMQWCTVTDCTGVALVDGSTSAGILATTYFGPGTTMTLYPGNIITDNTVGLAVGYDASDTSTVLAQFNTFANNTDYGVSTTNGPTVDALWNYWGDYSGPTHASNPGGIGDAITDGVTYNYLTAPISDSEHNPFPAGDMNYDHAVDFFDLGVLADNWLVGTE